MLFPRDIAVDDIPERLALYEKIRDGRAHKVQALTRIAGMDLNDANRGNFNSESHVLSPIMQGQF